MFQIKRRLFKEFVNSEKARHELRYLFWECTLRCNLNCLHCGSDCTTETNIADMPANDFLEQAKRLSKHVDANKITVVITGGEPLLRPDLEDIGLQLRKMGFRWSIVSNGLAYTEQRHRKLMAAGIGAVTISIDGLRDNHNWLRQNNKSFNNANNALELLAQTPRINFDVVTCVNPSNIDQLNELYDYFLQKNLKNWRLFTIAPKGRAENNNKLMLDNKQMKLLMDFIAAKRFEKKLNINFSCEAYVGTYEEKVRDGYFFCRAGIHIGSILCDGGVNACPNIDRSFNQGNIYDNDFWDIWNKQFSAMRNRIWMKKDNCATCKEYKWCGGSGMHLWDADKNLLQCHCAAIESPNA